MIIPPKFLYDLYFLGYITQPVSILTNLGEKFKTIFYKY